MTAVIFTITAILLIAALYVKRHTITNRGAIALGLAAILIFLILSGAINAIPVPSISLHLP